MYAFKELVQVECSAEEDTVYFLAHLVSQDARCLAAYLNTLIIIINKIFHQKGLYAILLYNNYNN